MGASLTFEEIMAISLVLPILFVLSIICAAITFERFIYYLRYARVSGSVLNKVRAHMRGGHYNEAKKEALKKKSFVTQALVAQIDSVHLPRNERESLMIFNHQRFQSLLQKRIWVFGTLSFICPLIGLFGTVLGVMTAFRDLALSGSGGPTIVAAGISEALYATAGGIGVAIMAAVIYNWFNIWMKESLTSSDLISQEMILMTAGKGK